MTKQEILDELRNLEADAELSMENTKADLAAALKRARSEPRWIEGETVSTADIREAIRTKGV